MITHISQMEYYYEDDDGDDMRLVITITWPSSAKANDEKQVLGSVLN